MDDDQPILPKDFIYLKNEDKLECSEWKIDSDRSKFVDYYWGLFVVYKNIAVMSNSNSNQLISTNIFDGKISWITLDQPDSIVNILKYVPIDSQHSFIFYLTSDEVWLSLVCLSNEKIRTVGQSHLIRKRDQYFGVYDLTFVPENNIVYAQWTDRRHKQTLIHIFKYDHHLLQLKSSKSICIPSEVLWLWTCDDGKNLVFGQPKIRCCEIDSMAFYNIKDRKLTPLENTRIDVKYLISYYGPTGPDEPLPLRKTETSHYWHKNTLFVLWCCKCVTLHPIPTKIKFCIFDLNQKKWSEIKMNFLWVGQAWLDFTLTDGIITFVSHENKPDDESFYQLNFKSYRLALGMPEKLTNLTLAKVQKKNLKKIAGSNISFCL